MLAGCDPRRPPRLPVRWRCCWCSSPSACPCWPAAAAASACSPVPSVGFLLGYPVAAFVVGWLTERGGPTYRLAWGLVANVVGGIVVLYAARHRRAWSPCDLGVSVQAAAVATAGSTSPGTPSRWCSPPSSRAACTRPTRGCWARPPPRRGSARLSERPRPVTSADDPVAAFLAAHAAGDPVALRTSGHVRHARARWCVRRTRGCRRSRRCRARPGWAPSSRVWVPGPLTATMNLFAAVHATRAGRRARRRPRRRDARAPDPRRARPGLDDRPPWTGSTVVVAGDRLAPALHDRAVARRGAGAPLLRRRRAVLRRAGARTPTTCRPFPGVESTVRDGRDLGALAATSAPGTTDRPARCAWTPTASRPSATGRRSTAGRLTVHGRAEAVTVGGSDRRAGRRRGRAAAGRGRESWWSSACRTTALGRGAGGRADRRADDHRGAASAGPHASWTGAAPAAAVVPRRRDCPPTPAGKVDRAALVSLRVRRRRPRAPPGLAFTR